MNSVVLDFSLESTEMVVIKPEQALDVFKSGDSVASILERISELARSVCLPDTSTSSGRKEIGSLAHKIAKSKTYLDGVGKDVVSELKALPKLVDSNRKTLRDGLDALKGQLPRPEGRGLKKPS